MIEHALAGSGGPGFGEGGGVYGYYVASGDTATIKNGQYMFMSAGDGIDVDGTLELEGRVIELEDDGTVSWD